MKNFLSRTKLLILLNVTVLTVLTVLVLLFITRYQGPSIIENNNATTSTESSSEPEVNSDTMSQEEIPAWNVVYLVRSFDKKQNKEDWAVVLNEFINFRSYVDGSETAEFKDPKEIFRLESGRRFSFRNFYYADEDRYFYFTVINTSRSDYHTEYIYQIDFQDNFKSKLIWSRNLMVKDNKYGNNDGDGSISLISEDKYMALSIATCYSCGGGPSAKPGLLIIDLLTLKEKYLGEVGNPSFDLEAGKVRANNYILVEEPCEIGYQCEDGTWMVAKPEGEEVTFDLP